MNGSRATAPLGVILAGGRSRRFGRRKAWAEVGGRPMVERVRDALAAVVDDVVLIANEPGPFSSLDLPIRPDAVPGAGPLAGIEAGLAWADARGRDGAIIVACDMPFITAALLSALVGHAETAGTAILVPESHGPRGFEPLCAYYGVEVLNALRERLDAGDHALAGVVHALGARRLALAEVETFGDPAALFLNVNDATDLDHAEAFLQGCP